MKLSADKKQLLKLEPEDLVSNAGRVIVPESVTQIEDYACSGYKDLTTIIFSNHVVRMGTGVFSGCDNLTFVRLSNNLQHLGDFCFAKCINLRQIILPGSITEWGYQIFLHCDNLSAIVTDEDKCETLKACLPSSFQKRVLSHSRYRLCQNAISQFSQRTQISVFHHIKRQYALPDDFFLTEDVLREVSKFEWSPTHQAFQDELYGGSDISDILERHTRAYDTQKWLIKLKHYRDILLDEYARPRSSQMLMLFSNKKSCSKKMVYDRCQAIEKVIAYFEKKDTSLELSASEKELFHSSDILREVLDILPLNSPELRDL